MNVHLVDGTYELFRHYYAVPPSQAADDTEIAAVRAVLGSILGMLESGVTHIGVPTHHVIASLPHSPWSGYNSGSAVDP